MTYDVRIHLCWSKGSGSEKNADVVLISIVDGGDNLDAEERRYHRCGCNCRYNTLALAGTYLTKYLPDLANFSRRQQATTLDQASKARATIQYP